MKIEFLEMNPPCHFDLTLVVKIRGMGLPFRLRCATSDHAAMLDQLDDFMNMIRLKLYDKLEE